MIKHGFEAKKPSNVGYLLSKYFSGLFIVREQSFINKTMEFVADSIDSKCQRGKWKLNNLVRMKTVF